MLLVLIGAFGTLGTPVAWWATGLVSSTDRYVATVAPLATTSAVQDVVIADVTTRVKAAVSAPIAALRLPPASRILTGAKAAGTAAIDREVHSTVTQIITSSRFLRLWTALNRAAHPSVAAILTGRGAAGGLVTVSGNLVILDTTTVVKAVEVRLVSAGLSFAATLPAAGSRVVLARVDHLQRLQHRVRFVEHAASWLPWLSAASFGLAVAFARHRRATFITTGAATMIAMGLLTSGRFIARSRVGIRTTHPALIDDSFQVVTQTLQHAVDLLGIAGGVVVLIGATAALLPLNPLPHQPATPWLRHSSGH